jgi:nucleoside permease NupC
MESSDEKRTPILESGVPKMKTREIVGFYLSGLFNNSSYVIMIAGAKNIAPRYQKSCQEVLKY